MMPCSSRGGWPKEYLNGGDSCISSEEMLRNCALGERRSRSSLQIELQYNKPLGRRGVRDQEMYKVELVRQALWR